jgi:wobble nucleotide-excising tRNase
LYFYCLVQGSWKQEDLRKGKIVIIDDPVSSMDSGVLSIVGTLVRDMIDDCFLDGVNYNIGQIFILTHNPYFHNAVSQTMLQPDEMYYKKIAFFEVKKDENNVSTISEPCVQESSSKDPDITHENISPVQNSYTALWQEYKEAKLPSTLLHLIHRIVETYFVLICNYSRDYLRNKALAFVDSDVNKQRLVREILLNLQDSTAIDDSMGEMIYFPAPSSAGDYKGVFRDVFKAMEQEPHYAKMSGEGIMSL